MLDIKGTTSIVTGGTSGIGYATAKELIGRGANLVINSRTASARFAELVAEGEKVGIRALHVIGDMRDPEVSKAICSKAMSEFGRIDSVVHCAGGPAPGAAVDMPAENWTDAFDVHVHSAFHLFRAAHPSLASRGGAVILLSSAAALRGCPGNTAYQVVKAALIQMTRALARDHAAEGIRVNCVAPGIIRTPFQDGMTDIAKANNIANRIPLKREGRPEDVADVIVQLIGNEFMTGETIVIDGGMSMRMV
ncbi:MULTISPECIES: SDR family NAD(P)-dependent oxidoreductase [Rhizobium]|uniref:SDR family NAD(P)-dependent oxidoreductase n=1 Tax=Rhizobium rhododendri TaxID=2506430 RepID=A0ABY8IQ60_9HYPH|nr:MULTISPECIES: SDR family oxidoreductase [Rhizobium]MBO9188066.1 SDR family oxidoreductase [Rhizobium sp. E27B/91]WFS25175.1 SDR family NAD(P)-dependent oxidoreductase [Rhizobium rhododendri]